MRCRFYRPQGPVQKCAASQAREAPQYSFCPAPYRLCPRFLSSPDWPVLSLIRCRYTPLWAAGHYPLYLLKAVKFFPWLQSIFKTNIQVFNARDVTCRFKIIPQFPPQRPAFVFTAGFRGNKTDKKKLPQKNAGRQNAARRPKNVIFHFTLPSVFFKCSAGCFKPPPGSIQAASAQKQTSVRLGIFPVHFHYPAYQGFQIPVQDGLDGIRICPHTKGKLHLAGI